MRKYDVNTLNEQEFDTLLQDGIPALPPDDIVHDVTPWRKAIHRILIGFALGTITLNFAALNYLLPTIGIILTILGFRTLQKENRWFRVCWILTLIRSTWFFSAFILNTTVYQDAFFHSALASVLNVLNVLICLLLYICFWRALLTVKEKAGLDPHAGGAAALIGWNAFVCAFGLLQVPGDLIMGILLLIAYVCIIRSLVKLSKELDEAGYCISVAPVRLTDRIIVLALTLLLLTGCACGYIFFRQYPMDWQPASQTETDETKEVREHLVSLGFPEHILDDLTQEDLLSCKGALRVVVDVNDHPVNNGRQVMEVQAGIIHYSTVFDQKELRITGIAVELPGQQEQWRIIHHFQWVIDPGFHGTDVIQLWTAYKNGMGWLSGSEVTGQVLYNDGAQIYAAPYFSLGPETYTTNTIFWGAQTSSNIFAAFSMPNQGEKHRGYVSYTIKEAQAGWIIDAWINFTHQKTWLQYPALTAKQKILTSGISSSNTFITIQDALQYYPSDADSDLPNGGSSKLQKNN